MLKDRLLNWLQEKVEQVEDDGDEASLALTPGYALHFAYAGVDNESSFALRSNT